MLLNYRHTPTAFLPAVRDDAIDSFRDFYEISQAGLIIGSVDYDRFASQRYTWHVTYDLFLFSLLLSFSLLSSYTISITSCALRCAPLRVWTYEARIYKKDTARNERATGEQCNDKRAWTQPGIVPISARKEAHPPALNKLDIQFTWCYAKDIYRSSHKFTFL